jgi:hypothetical protein
MAESISILADFTVGPIVKYNKDSFSVVFGENLCAWLTNPQRTEPHGLSIGVRNMLYLHEQLDEAIHEAMGDYDD